MPDLPTGTVTFLFTDIEGSTRLWGQYPEAMKAALARHDALLRTAIEAHGGYVFKTVGDAFCAAFDTAPDALVATLAAQRVLRAEAWGQTGELRVRMALHTGAAEERDSDYFGPPLNRVARLLSTGYGGQILLSLATEELVRDYLPEGTHLQDLGAHRLKDLVRPEKVFQLIAPDLPSSFPLLKSLDTFPNNLPFQLTSFIGREREMGEVQRLLNSTRLVTLTGSGGTGKTRLSLQVAAELLDSFADGVWLVELAPLRDPLLVPQAVATVLGVRDDSGQPLLATLTGYLREKQVLLVLDNCEHLVEACAQLAEALLRTCPKLRLMASSREGLGIGGETVFRVPSLSLPDTQHLPPIEALTQYEAVQLFIDRAVAVVPAFAVTNQNAPALAQVCHRLDGIPLAIELAAVRVKVLSVEQIAARLDDRFRLLTGGSRTAQQRQQTLRAAIDWSYELLPEPERVLLRRLSVFAGGFTLEAAEAVCVGEGVVGADLGVRPEEVLDLLSHLVDKSLVGVEKGGVGADLQAGPSVRYRLLETIRQYGRERLEASGEAERTWHQHTAFFSALALAAEPELGGPQQVAWLGRLEQEHDNLRAALAWSQVEPGSGEVMLRLSAALWRFWHVHGHASEGRRWLERALAGSESLSTASRAKALHGSGALAHTQADFTAARFFYEQSLVMWGEVGDPRGFVNSVDELGHTFNAQGEFERAMALFEESLALRRELGDKGGVAASLNALGHMARSRGDYEQAAALCGESLSLRRELGDKEGIAYALQELGEVAIGQGNSRRAEALLQESLSLRREVGNKWGIAESLRLLGRVAHSQGDWDAARSLYEESLAIAGEVGDKMTISACLRRLAVTVAAQGQFGAAARLFGASEALRKGIGADAVQIPPAARTEYEREVAAVRAGLDEAAFAATWAEGRAMTMEQAVEYALRPQKLRR